MGTISAAETVQQKTDEYSDHEGEPKKAHCKAGQATTMVWTALSILRWMCLLALTGMVLLAIGSAVMTTYYVASTTASMVCEAAQAMMYICLLCAAKRAASQFAPVIALAPMVLRVLWAVCFPLHPSAEPLMLQLPPLNADDDGWASIPAAITSIMAVVGYAMWK